MGAGKLWHWGPGPSPQWTWRTPTGGPPKQPPPPPPPSRPDGLTNAPPPIDPALLGFWPASSDFQKLIQRERQLLNGSTVAPLAPGAHPEADLMDHKFATRAVALVEMLARENHAAAAKGRAQTPWFVGVGFHLPHEPYVVSAVLLWCCCARVLLLPRSCSCATTTTTSPLLPRLLLLLLLHYYYFKLTNQLTN